MTSAIDLDDVEDTRKRFNHEVPYLYREAFDLLLAEVKQHAKPSPGVCQGCGCEESLELPVIQGPGDISLCLVCTGVFHHLTQGILRERDERAVQQAREDRERILGT